MSTSFTKQRTYSRADFQAAKAEWDAGEYDTRYWSEWRYLAAQAGIVKPPTGTRWDSWGDEHPSERALIGRAIEESPTRLRAILRSGRVHSWAQVIRALLIERDELAQSAVSREREWLARKVERPTHIGDIARTIRDSLESVR